MLVYLLHILEGKKCSRAQHEVYSEEADAGVTPRDQEHVMMTSCLLAHYWLLYRGF